MSNNVQSAAGKKTTSSSLAFGQKVKEAASALTARLSGRRSCKACQPGKRCPTHKAQGAARDRRRRESCTACQPGKRCDYHREVAREANTKRTRERRLLRLTEKDLRLCHVCLCVHPAPYNPFTKERLGERYCKLAAEYAYSNDTADPWTYPEWV
jgi:hypothetical protein